MDKQNKIEVNNLLEDVSTELEKCIKCGMCKNLCPVFKILREESVSPRGKSIILSEKLLGEVIFKCNLCKACEEKCPLELKICDKIVKAREAMVLSGKEIKQNKEMIENIRKYSNPIGEVKEGEKAKLYCC
jgi:glycolate oxidase iron-sulfur subunit